MRSRTQGTFLSTALCCLAVWATISGCIGGPEPDTEAEGYVTSYVNTFMPRQLMVWFVDGTSETDAEAVIATSGSSVLWSDPIDPIYMLIGTPLGYSLLEINDTLEADPLVDFCLPNFIGYFDTFGFHGLMAEDGSAMSYWLRESGVDLQSVAYEYIVRVRGFYQGEANEGVGIMNVTSVEILRDRVVRRGGRITLIDRGSDGVAVVLVDGLQGKAWELLGPLAQEIAGLSSVEGAVISVRGCERPESVTSRAGGRELRVVSYELVSGLDDVRLLVSEALNYVTYASGSNIFFLPIEMGPGTVIRPPDDSGQQTVTLDKTGYLVFIDEEPDAWWEHPAKIVFVEAGDPTQPDILFTDLPAWWLHIRDPAGNQIAGPWVEY